MSQSSGMRVGRLSVVVVVVVMVRGYFLFLTGTVWLPVSKQRLYTTASVASERQNTSILPEPRDIVIKFVQTCMTSQIFIGCTQAQVTALHSSHWLQVFKIVFAIKTDLMMDKRFVLDFNTVAQRCTELFLSQHSVVIFRVSHH